MLTLLRFNLLNKIKKSTLKNISLRTWCLERGHQATHQTEKI